MPAGLGVEGDEVRRGDRAVPWLAHGGGEITLWGLNFLLFGFPFPFPLSSRTPPPPRAVALGECGAERKTGTDSCWLLSKRVEGLGDPRIHAASAHEVLGPALSHQVH